MRKIRIALASTVLAGLGLLASAGAASASTHPHAALRGNLAATATGTTVRKSDFVAGYVATAKTGGATSFKYATATFKVPALNCPASGFTEVEHYAGLGGWSDSFLDAAGLDEWCNSGTASYAGSYWYPAYDGGYPSDSLAVSPGDTLVASVFYTASADTVQDKIVDTTTGQFSEQVFSCYGECGTKSAEVFTAGNLNGNGTGTPNFGKVSFSGIKASAGNEGVAAPLNSSKNTLTKVAEHGPVTNLVDVQPGTLTSASLKSSFANTWERQNAPRQ